MTVTPVQLVSTQYGEVVLGNYLVPVVKGVRGYGAEAYGDPYGAGGPLSVVNALAVEGQRCRVVFNEEPRHFSAADASDALNPANYVFSIVIGQGTAPTPIGVDPLPKTYPAVGVRAAGQFALDVLVDAPLVLGLRYAVSARSIQSRAGLGLGFSYGAPFVGVAAPRATRPRPRRTDLADMATTGLGGAFAFDEGGDVAVAAGLESLRTRVLRRCTTALNAFAFLGGYGTPLRLKGPVTLAELANLQRDLRKQVGQEPEVEKVAVAVAMVALPGILTVNVQVRAKRGSLSMGLDVQADGTISVR